MRRDQAVLFAVASVTHEFAAGAVSASDPEVLLSVVWQSALFSEPVVSPLPIRIPAAEFPPEVIEFHTPKVCLYGVSQLPARTSPIELEKPIAEFRPPQLFPVVAAVSRDRKSVV